MQAVDNCIMSLKKEPHATDRPPVTVLVHHSSKPCACPQLAGVQYQHHSLAVEAE